MSKHKGELNYKTMLAVKESIAKLWNYIKIQFAVPPGVNAVLLKFNWIKTQLPKYDHPNPINSFPLPNQSPTKPTHGMTCKFYKMNGY